MIEVLFGQNTIVMAALVFYLRLFDMALDTIRVLAVMRGRKIMAWVMGFCQASIYIMAIGAVLDGLDDPVRIFGYAAGFATGNVVGMLIEEKLLMGYSQLSIISPLKGMAIAEIVRSEGYAITEIPAHGKNGMVSMLSCSVTRKRLNHVLEIVRRIDDTAFITEDEIRIVRRGFFRA